LQIHLRDWRDDLRNDGLQRAALAWFVLHDASQSLHDKIATASTGARTAGIPAQIGVVLQERAMNKPIILCEIENVVASALVREQTFVDADWDAFHADAINDAPIIDGIEFINSLARNYMIIGLTTRQERWRNVSMQWLVRHEVRIDKLLMRPDADFSAAPEMKMRLCANELDVLFPSAVAMIIDPREDVIAAFRERGIHGLHFMEASKS
jgi:hypothetical protein